MVIVYMGKELRIHLFSSYLDTFNNDNLVGIDMMLNIMLNDANQSRAMPERSV